MLINSMTYMDKFTFFGPKKKMQTHKLAEEEGEEKENQNSSSISIKTN